ncbi:MAG: DUF2914 domain-containing protein [Polyangiales bacterium]
MASTRIVVSLSLSALVVSGVAMWRAESHASPRDRHPAAPVTPVVVAPTPAPAPVVAAPTPAPIAAHAPVAPVINAPAGALAVRRIAVGTGVADREVVGHASEYELTSDARFCAVVELSNHGAPGAVRVRFEHDGDRARSVGHVRLSVPTAPRWRTWGCTERIQTPGTWSAVVESLDGRELARDVFTVR